MSNFSSLSVVISINSEERLNSGKYRKLKLDCDLLIQLSLVVFPSRVPLDVPFDMCEGNCLLDGNILQWISLGDCT